MNFLFQTVYFATVAVATCCGMSVGGVVGNITLKLHQDELDERKFIPPFAFDYSAHSCLQAESALSYADWMCTFSTKYYWNDQLALNDPPHRGSKAAFLELADNTYNEFSFFDDKHPERTISNNLPLITLLAIEPSGGADNFLDPSLTPSDTVNRLLQTGPEFINITLFNNEVLSKRKQTLPKVAYFTPGSVLSLLCSVSMMLNQTTINGTSVSANDTPGVQLIRWRYPTAAENRIKIVHLNENTSRNDLDKVQSVSRLSITALKGDENGKYSCFFEQDNENGTTIILMQSETYEIEIVQSDRDILFRQIVPEGDTQVNEKDDFTFEINYQTALGHPISFHRTGRVEFFETPDAERGFYGWGPSVNVLSRCESRFFNYNATIINCNVAITFKAIEFQDSASYDVDDSYAASLLENTSRAIKIHVTPRKLSVKMVYVPHVHSPNRQHLLVHKQVYLETSVKKSFHPSSLTCVMNSASSDTVSMRMERKLLSSNVNCSHHYHVSKSYASALAHLKCLKQENNQTPWESVMGDTIDSIQYKRFIHFETHISHQIAPESTMKQMLYRCLAVRNETTAVDRAEDSLVIVFTDVADPFGTGIDIVEWNKETREPLLPLSERQQRIEDGMKSVTSDVKNPQLFVKNYGIKDRYYESERLVLACRVPKYRLYMFKNEETPVKWYAQEKYSTDLPLPQSGGAVELTPAIRAFGPRSPVVYRYDIGQLRTTLLEFSKLSLIHRGNYTCLGYFSFADDDENKVAEEDDNGKTLEVRSVLVDVVLPVKPYFEYDQDYPALITRVPYGRQYSLVCRPQGDPLPTVTWLKNKLPFGNKNGGINLSFPLITERDEGLYSCVAESKFGKLVKHTSLEVTDAPVRQSTLISIIMGTIISFIIVVAALIGCIIYRNSKQRKELQTLRNELIAFASYDSSFEIEKERFEVDIEKKLGEGGFGIVYQGVLSEQKVGNNSKLIAIKVPKDGKNPLHQSMLLDEMKIMMTIGKHVNILTLIGACTSNMVKGELYILMELCPMDSMEAYLRKEGQSIHTEKVASVVRKGTTSTEAKGYQGTIKTENPMEIMRNSLPTSRSTDQTDAQINRNHEITFIQHSFALQTANGMDYLGSKLLIHRDLAARNLLLTLHNGVIVVKIADYGFARQRQTYRLRGSDDNQPQILPVAWMSPESLHPGHYTIQSDIWSFGVVLWEIFTLGDNPEDDYANRLSPDTPESFVPRLSDFLQRDGRLSQPSLCSTSLFQLMSDCWAMNPDKRPSFASCRKRIFTDLEMLGDAEKCRQLTEMLNFKTAATNDEGEDAIGCLPSCSDTNDEDMICAANIGSNNFSLVPIEKRSFKIQN